MRKGRYVINDEVADIDRITGLNWSIDGKNTVSVRWGWPRNGGVKLAAVFYADSADEPLEKLLEDQQPVIITKDMDKSYARPLDAARRVYRVFPAYFGEGKDIVILEQKDGTATDPIIKVVTVGYRLEYKPLTLSEYCRVHITLSCSDLLPDGCAPAYSKYRDGARICEYPLPGASGAYVCYLKKNEEIKIYVPEEYSDNIILVQEKS
ncbi:MAG: hypothetical protein FWE68_00990 [Defluviitaleaceae bacterium]|nr:hypothetical protein [Defluviitaleaceae bacterium]